MRDDLVLRWLSRALVASFLVNVLLSVWLWSARREPENVKEATREYVAARVVYDTAKVEREVAVTRYRTLRDTLRITDTTQVRSALTLADEVIRKDSVALAAADTALARADSLISVLRRSTKPRLLQPFAEILYSPYSREYAGRLGVEVRTIRNVALIAATEIRKDGPGFAVGVRYRF